VCVRVRACAFVRVRLCACVWFCLSCAHAFPFCSFASQLCSRLSLLLVCVSAVLTPFLFAHERVCVIACVCVCMSSGV